MTKKHAKLIFERKEAMKIVIVLAIGILIGCIITKIIFQIGSIGSLRIDTSDPDDEPYLFLELSKSVKHIYRQKYVTLKVNTKSYIPHK